MSLLEQLDLAARPSSALSTEMFGVLRAFVYEKTGIYFQDNKQYLLESRVGQRLRALGMRDFTAYFNFVRNGGAFQELPLLINAVTINETFFFRNPPQFEVLEQEVLPALLARRASEGKRRIKIWSAACSTGDEPYTLAILIKERLLPKYPGVQFEIVGTDINTEVLETARAGVYGPYAVRSVPPHYLNRYFTAQGARYTLAPEVRRMVSFQQMNLVDRNAMARMRDVDVILCANVLIYFDQAAKQQAVTGFYSSLNPGGYLLVGFSETLYGVTQAFLPVRLNKTIAYQKAS